MGSVRLTKIVSLIPKCDTLADVGCDHGYVGIDALETGRAKRVVFVDISTPSLEKARLNCPQQYEKQVEFLCQDGLRNLVADCAVIAGMGGLEIISILEEAKALPQQLVLQPMRNQRDVRQYLQSNYNIVVDEKFFDGKFYDLIFAQRCKIPDKLTELELEFGKTNILHPTEDFTNFLVKEQTKLTTILQGCNDLEVEAKLQLINKAIAAVQED